MYKLSTSRNFLRNLNTRKALLIYFVGLFLLDNAVYVDWYFLTDGQFPNQLGHSTPPVTAYFQTPFFLLLYSTFYTIEVLCCEQKELATLATFSFLFSLWFLAGLVFFLVRFLYRKMSKGGQNEPENATGV